MFCLSQCYCSILYHLASKCTSSCSVTNHLQPTVCETTEGVRSFSGYVHLPPHSINETHESQDYPINTSVRGLPGRNSVTY